MSIKSKELDIWVSPSKFSVTKMDIKHDLTEVAISSDKKTTFFIVKDGHLEDHHLEKELGGDEDEQD